MQNPHRLPGSITITLKLFQMYSLEFYTRNMLSDLSKGLGDVLNLVVQEYCLHFSLPFKRLKAIWHKAIRPKELWVSEECVQFFRCAFNMTFRNGYVSLHQSRCRLRGGICPSKGCTKGPLHYTEEPNGKHYVDPELHHLSDRVMFDAADFSGILRTNWTLPMCFYTFALTDIKQVKDLGVTGNMEGRKHKHSIDTNKGTVEFKE